MLAAAVGIATAAAPVCMSRGAAALSAGCASAAPPMASSCARGGGATSTGCTSFAFAAASASRSASASIAAPVGGCPPATSPHGCTTRTTSSSHFGPTPAATLDCHEHRCRVQCPLKTAHARRSAHNAEDTTRLTCSHKHDWTEAMSKQVLARRIVEHMWCWIRAPGRSLPAADCAHCCKICSISANDICSN